MAIDMGMIVCGSPATVREQLESHWNDMHFDNLLTMLHFGNLSEELTRCNMDLFAKEVLPNLQAMKRAAPAQASA
ncbi:MAG TPA: hypothetical protein DIS96_08680 [Pusillimonas sp.]|nr:hypothetical protein [Pusillimonas sp.]